MATKLFLIRHGSTDWNVKHRYCGFVDVSLNAKGVTQAKRLGKRLKGETIHKVYSSDRKRALQTAAIVFEGHGIEVVPDLREMHFGIFEGLTYKQIIKKFPLLYKKWLKDPFKVAIPRGENLDMLKKRVVSAFKKIILRHPGQSVAVVCHGGSISSLIIHVLKSKDFWRHIPLSASLTIAQVKGRKFKLILLNDVTHLSGIKIDAVKFK